MSFKPFPNNTTALKLPKDTKINEISCACLRSIINRCGIENVCVTIMEYNDELECGKTPIKYHIYHIRQDSGAIFKGSCSCMYLEDFGLNTNKNTIFTDNNFTKKLYN